MHHQDSRDREILALRDRLSRLSQASLRITEDLDFDTVLQVVVDAARSLTSSRYGAITVFGDAGQTSDFIGSGLTPEERQGLRDMPEGLGFFEYLSGLEEPLRVSNIDSHLKALDMPDFLPGISVTSVLVAPILHRGLGVGTIYLAHETEEREFSQEDEETLVLFASQAAMAIANARRRQEERRARADLETLINTSPVGVAVFDALTGLPKSFNREARRIMDNLRDPGQTPEDLLELMSLRRADGREVSLQEFSMTYLLSIGETLRAEEIVLRAPDGRSVTVLLNATPILSDGGLVESMVVTMQDMADVVETERLRAEFLSHVSHELREPLTSIKGSAVNLRESLDSLDKAEVLQFVRIIESQSDRMRDLIGELLDVARIRTGSLSVTPEPAEVITLVDEARNAFLAGGWGRNIVLDLEPDLPWVMADRRRIVQVLGNLLSNAVRNSPDTSDIRLSGALQDGSVALSVADRGRGVDPERLHLLFRKFSHLDGSGLDRDTAGSGLGLPICKGIVEAHGGRIWAESEGVGLGTRFTFTLPVAEGVGAGTALLPDSPRSETGERESILVVDDDPMTLRTVRDILSRAGYMPLVVGEPEEALRLFESERPGLALLDLVLPGSDDGIDLMINMLRIRKAPVIFLSAYGRDEIIAKALEHGAVDYIVKPFSPTELLTRVRAALRRSLALPPDEPSEPFVLGDLTLDYVRREVSVAGRPVSLTPTEYALLRELSVNAGLALTFDHLLERVWGLKDTGNRGNLRSYVRRLRTKLGDNAGSPRYIFPEPRVGYRMAKPETQDDDQDPPPPEGSQE
ncbi:MAG: response regulator [Dehalococcoidia bacterium]|nr:response regulator [Dehalococcoidia bacterium]